MALKFSVKKAHTLFITSFSDPDVRYAVDPKAVTCSCKAFEKAKHCKHLEALGIWPHKPFTPKTHPTFSQALCALVKALRIRRPEEAIYWMVYMDGPAFSEDQYRFRVARRLLIGSSEDGMSIPVMEKCVENFPKLLQKKTPLLYLVAEAIRICKVPNWWHPDSNGPSYIYDSLIGQRKWWATKWPHSVHALEEQLVSAIDLQDPQKAIGGVMMYGNTKEKPGSTKQAEFLLKLAEERQHPLAIRLCNIHLQAKSALSSDNNFLVQAVWHMAGRSSPVQETLYPVTAGECYEALERAKESWKTPHPVPTWACDGVHCAGNDTRFMGMLMEMNSVCNAFTHYGRIDPNDLWLPAFKCYDELEIT